MPIKGEEDMYNIPPKEETSSQQTPYSKEIVDLMTRITRED